MAETTLAELRDEHRVLLLQLSGGDTVTVAGEKDGAGSDGSSSVVSSLESKLAKSEKEVRSLHAELLLKEQTLHELLQRGTDGQLSSRGTTCKADGAAQEVKIDKKILLSMEKLIYDKDAALAEAEQELEVSRDGQERMMKQLDVNLGEMQAVIEAKHAKVWFKNRVLHVARHVVFRNGLLASW